MEDSEVTPLLLSRGPSRSHFWLRGYAHGYQGLGFQPPNDASAAEAYRKGYEAGKTDGAKLDRTSPRVAAATGTKDKA